ncbi:MAG TPA: glycosyltransferase family 39 protein, partial [Thermoanaerobaculia bacterium]|nr:glycosyltransferase family 39 protein [Thermoanaerobaculia bacterium]
GSVGTVSRRPLALSAILIAAAATRLWRLDAVGFNSDEAVYAGQAAALAGDPELSAIFPIFRAHPLLFHVALSGLFRFGVDDHRARLVVVAIGVATVALTYAVGVVLWDRPAGLLAALFLALQPYHVVVTRQVLLDGPMTLFTTAALLCLAVYAKSARPVWLTAMGASLALACLTKETAVVLLGAVALFFLITPAVRANVRVLGGAALAFVGIVAAHPLALVLAGGGGASTARSYLVWQLLRRPNHEWTFYTTSAAPALGLLLVATAVVGLWRPPAPDRFQRKLLLSWIAPPALFFALWPVKGYQYLLPIAPAIALLAAGALSAVGGADDEVGARRRTAAPRSALVVAIAASLVVGAWSAVVPSRDPTEIAAAGGRLLAGAGGVPGGRAVGEWVRSHVPDGATVMTIGPSMANVVQFYGRRRALGLSVSSDPLRRNPAYAPIRNPDLALRRGDIQYLVWDRFSAARSRFFSDRLLRYVEKYDGRKVHAEPELPGIEPLIVVYEVRP